MFYLMHVKNSIIAVTLLVALGLVGCQSVRRVKGPSPPTPLVTEKFETDPLNPGVRHGKYTSYYNKKKYTEGYYEHGKKSGEWRYYDDNETLSFKGYFKAGKRNGTWELYPEVNYVRSKMVYKNGEKDSTWTCYGENGKLAFTTIYVDGSKEGPSYAYFKDGKMMRIINYVNGERHGNTKTYFPTGDLFMEMEFKEGNKHNLLSLTDFNGDSVYGGTMEDGNGLLVSYYLPEDTGSALVRAARENYKNGELDGEVRYYHRNGKLKSSGYYKADSQVGIWDHFKETGILDRTDTITEGKGSTATWNHGSSGKEVTIELMPTFPGGDTGLLNFLAKNIRYPRSAKQNGVAGTVYVSFVVNSFGAVEEIKILRGIGGGCDEEVIRLMRIMPRWNPGIQKGFPVKIQYNLPVKFVLR